MNVSAIKCSKCGSKFSVAQLKQDDFVECSRCRQKSKIKLFPSLIKKEEAAKIERITEFDEGAAHCFYHEDKKTAAICDYCGCFMCALCDIELDGKHICPKCLEKRSSKDELDSLVNKQVQHHMIALFVALIGPCFLAIPSFFAVVYAIRGLKAKPNIYAKSAVLQKTVSVIALIIASLSIIGLGFFIFRVVYDL